MAGQTTLIDFDVYSFGQSILQTIDSFRVRSSDYQLFKQNNPGGAVSVESRIDAFLRIMGFQSYYVSFEKDEVDILNNYVGDREFYLMERQEFTIENSNASKEEKIIQGLKAIYMPNNPEPEYKNILPLVWGAIEVPENRTILEPFEQSFTEEKFPRSTLEAIIELRVNRFEAGRMPDSVRQFLIEKFGNVKDEAKEIVESFYGASPENYSAISLITLGNFNLIMDKIAEFHLELIQTLNKLQPEINYVPQATVDGQPLLKSNNVEGDYGFDQMFSKRNIKLLILKTQRDLIESTVNSFIADQEVDFGLSAQATRSAITVVDNMLMDPILSIMKSDVKELNTEIAKIQDEVDRLEAEMEKVRAGMELLYGTTSGISIIDVICVIWALFEIDKNTLVSLLNDHQYARLLQTNTDRDISSSGITRSLNINEAYKKLEETFVSIYKQKVIPKIKARAKMPRVFDDRSS